jgi:uncharacterized protein YjaG (DUF416 family)
MEQFNYKEFCHSTNPDHEKIYHDIIKLVAARNKEQTEDTNNTLSCENENLSIDDMTSKE